MPSFATHVSDMSDRAAPACIILGHRRRTLAHLRAFDMYIELLTEAGACMGLRNARAPAQRVYIYMEDARGIAVCGAVCHALLV